MAEAGHERSTKTGTTVVGSAALADRTPRAAPTAPPDSTRRMATVFVSYSRREFHFAEAATATLRSHSALDPWIDAQRLRPGMDWAKTLDESLDNADALLLLASPAAMASAYVRREWTRAAERGIPIHIGVVEAVDLPSELAGRPVYDLRTRFWKRAAALGEAIAQARTEPVAVAPRPNRLGLPGRMPASVAATAALAVLASLALVAATVVLVSVDIAVMRLARSPFIGSDWMWQDNALEVLRTLRWQRAMFALLGLTAMAAPLAPGVLIAGTWLLRRRSSQSFLLMGFGSTAAVGSFLFVFVGKTVGSPAPDDPFITEEVFPTPPGIASDTALLRALLAGAVVCAVTGGILVLVSRTLHLWLPTGAGAGYQRRRLAGMRLIRPDLLTVAGPKRYGPRLLTEWTSYDPWFPVKWMDSCARLAALPAPETPCAVEVLSLAPADEAVAGLIRLACREAGMAGGPSPARWVFVLVSSQAPWPETAQAIQDLGPRAICVLLDSLHLPADAEELRRHQWLDFRERHPDSLFPLLAALRSPTAEPADDGPAPAPAVADRFRAPVAVRQFVALGRNLAGALPGFALVALIFRPMDVQSPALAVVTVLAVVCLVRLGNRVATRRITAAGFRRGCLVTLAVLTLWVGVAFSILWTPLALSTVWGPTSFVTADIGGESVASYQPEIFGGVGNPHLLTLGAANLPVCVALILIMYYFPLRGLWLPPTVAPADARLPPVGWAAWRGFTPLVVTPGILFSLLIELIVLYPP
ncbi:MAG: toll/interleukin-1 receptor domain-containing protein [Nocardiopsaceae bacterium]|nr:toll/interleukin-1 receptor domain-containing protein [Nocardiopsaceae bacterium]